MADKELWQVIPVATDVKNDDGVIIGGQTAGTRYAPLTLIANYVHNLWAAFINAITPLKTSFASGDKFPIVNGSTATAMEADTLLELTAQNALADKVAPEFVENSTTTIAGYPYAYKGSLYVAKEAYKGSWNASKFESVNVSELIDKCVKGSQNAVFYGSSDNPNDLNNIKNDCVIFVQRASNTTTQNFPIDYPNSGEKAFLFVVKAHLVNSTDGAYQLLYIPSLGYSWLRSYNFSTQIWSDWVKSGVDPTQIIPVDKNAIFLNRDTNPASLNDLKENNFVVVVRNTTTTTQDFPSDYPTDSQKGFLLVSKSEWSFGTDVATQILSVPSSSSTWTRTYNFSTQAWTDWQKNQINLTDYPYVEPNAIFLNENTNPSDLDDLKGNRILYVQRSGTTQTQNFPSDYPTNLEKGFLFVVTSQLTSSVSATYQLLTIPTLGRSWIRAYNASTQVWSSWDNGGYVEKGITITIGTGGDYQTLRAGFAKAYSVSDSIVIVLPGTYNLLDEFADVLHNLTGSTGICCGNGMKVFFRDGAKVEAIFDNSESQWTQQEWGHILDFFNPFYAGIGDYEIDNLNIEAQNCRYCFHDELAGSGVYRHVYRNCHMIKRTTTSERRYMCCIGGGLGKNGTIMIDGGDYQSQTTYGMDIVDNSNPSSAQMCILWHNGDNANAKSSVEIKDVYLHDRGYVCIRDHGSSSYVTKVLVDGCSFGLPIAHFKTNASATDNMEVIGWNNEQRVQGVHWEPSVDKTTIDLVSD